MARLLRLLLSIILAIISLFLLFGEIDVQPVSFYILIFFIMRIVGLYCFLTSWNMYLKWYKKYKQFYITVLLYHSRNITSKHTIISRPFLSRTEVVERFIETSFPPKAITRYEIV